MQAQQTTFTYPQTSFYSPVPPVNIDAQPVNFCHAQQLADQITRLEDVYNVTVGEHSAIQQQVKELGIGQLDFDAKPIAERFQPNTTLPYPEMMKFMSNHKANIEGEIVKLADRTVTLRTKMEDQIKVRNYIAHINRKVPQQPTGCERLHRERVKHCHTHQIDAPQMSMQDLSRLVAFAVGSYVFFNDGSMGLTMVSSFLAYKAVPYISESFKNLVTSPFPKLNLPSPHAFRPVYVN